MDNLRTLAAAAIFLAVLAGTAFAACQGPANLGCDGYSQPADPGACVQAGCKWVNLPSTVCASYGESCAALGCCGSLVCDASKLCNQPSGTCNTLPDGYVPVQNSALFNSTGGPLETVQKLQGGAGTGPEGSKALTADSNLYKVGWFSDWKTAGLIGVAIAAALIAVAAMIGHGFNLPEVKAFVDTELSQAVVSALLIFAIFGLILFFDQTARLALYVSGLPLSCNSNEPCYVTAAKFYLNNLYEAANPYAQNQLQESVNDQRTASLGLSQQFNLWWLGFAGMSIRPNAGLTLRAERAAAIFETTSKLLASLNAQIYFLDVVSYGIAPIFLLLGILLRTFFFTRRLGGLLLAIAISLFIVYPLTYAFAWYTLNVTIYGERTAAASDPACPAECTARYPIAFYIGNGGKVVGFETAQQMTQAGITNGNWASGNVGGDAQPEFPGLVACRDLSATGLSQSVAPNECAGCPDYCRDTPFPTGMPGCDIAACSACNPGCKLLRQRTDCASQCDMKLCGPSCRTITPVENKCYDKNAGTGAPEYVSADLSVSCAECKACPTWCRINKRLADGTVELLYKDEPGCQVAACTSCPAQCMYETQVGSSSKCDESCSYNGVVCPAFCRVNGTISQPPDISRYDTTTPGIIPLCQSPEIAAACNQCPADCMINLPPSPAIPAAGENPSRSCAPYPDTSHVSQSCNDCPEYCRWNGYDFITNATTGKFANYSIAGVTGEPVVPYVCQEGLNGRLNCGGSACGGSCSAQEVPRFCRIFDQTDAAHPYYCRLCPPEVRVNLTYTDASGYILNGTALLDSSLTCEDRYCPPDDCKRVSPSDYSKVFQLPGQSAGCFDFNASYSYIEQRTPSGGLKFPLNCEMCLPFCRVITKASPADSDGLDKNLKSPLCGNVMQSRSTWCGIGNNGVCKDPSFDTGACCSAGLQCGDAPDLQTATTDQKVIGGSGSLSVTLQNPYSGNDPQYRWSFSASADLAPGENITWSAGGKNGKGLSGSDLSPLYSVGEVIFSNDGSSSNITGMSVDYYGYSPGTKKCMACDSMTGLHGSCADNYTAGCCGTDPTYGPLTCDNYTRTCEPLHVTIDPCSSRPDRLWGNAIYCPSTCQYPAPAGITCHEYVGNGPMCEANSDNNHNYVDCKKYTDSASCGKAPEGCHWRTDADVCTGPGTCWSYGKDDCAAHDADGCKWQPSDAITVPISLRKAPYNLNKACSQCPEYCRVASSRGKAPADCGIVDPNGEFIDCTTCPDVCYVSEPAGGSCGPSDPLTSQCEGCPALCRRQQGSTPDESSLPTSKPVGGVCPVSSYCSYSSTAYQNACSNGCRLDNAPAENCEACYSCPLDCTFYPAVRTDCSEVCSSEAISGPLEIGPTDYIRKLPGAQGESDVKAIGGLMVPALVLPLFCLVIVIAFIRVFSPTLGGDIEIPGLGRII